MHLHRPHQKEQEEGREKEEATSPDQGLGDDHGSPRAVRSGAIVTRARSRNASEVDVHAGTVTRSSPT